jgi:hypothetical protein
MIAIFAVLSRLTHLRCCSNNPQQVGVSLTTISSFSPRRYLDDYNSSGFLDRSGGDSGSSDDFESQPSASA